MNDTDNFDLVGAQGLDWDDPTKNLIALQGNKTKGASLDRQQAMADQLRARAIRGDGVVNGPAGNSATSRITVNPMAAVANVYGGYKASQMQGDIDAGRNSMDLATQHAGQGLLSGILKQRQAGRPAAAPGTQPAPGTPAAAALAQPLYADPNDYSMVP